MKEAFRYELQRNEALRRLIGITSRTKVPKAWNMSRFMEVLGQPPHAEHLHAVFDVMVQRLAQVVPDLGAATAGDASALNARRSRDRPNRDKHAAEQANPQTNEARKICYDVHGLPLPTGGRKEYKNDAGKATKVCEWFGYKFPLLVDVKHEVALAYQVSSTKAGDNHETHKLLHKAKIKPLIQTRSLWEDEHERRLPGHEPKRGTLKYRCPAVHEGWECPSECVCNKDRSYGLAVRVKEELDLRRFPPIPRATKKFERLYKGRAAVERVNARLKVFWGADDGNVTGATRFAALLGTVMVVHIAFATLLAQAPRWEGTLSQTQQRNRLAMGCARV